MPTVAPSLSSISVHLMANVAATGVAYGGSTIMVQALKVGTATVTLQLVNKFDKTKIIYSYSTTISVLNDADINSCVLGTSCEVDLYGTGKVPIYASDPTDRWEYIEQPLVYGSTASGGVVILANPQIIRATIGNTTDFKIVRLYGNGFDNYIYAIKGITPDKYATTASTNLTITLMGTDGSVHSLTKLITSSTVAAEAKSIDVSVANQDVGISLDSYGSSTVTITDSADNYNLLGLTTSYEAPGGNNPVSVNTTTGLATDGTATAYIDTNGQIHGTPKAGTTIVVSGVTFNLLTKSIRLIFN